MATRKQIEANRRNAKKSTGPVTPGGKAASSMNALKTGLHAKALVLPTEKAADLELLTAEYYDQFRPETAELRDLVDEYVTLVWQLRRLSLTEVALYKNEQDGFWQPDNVKHPQGQIASNSYRAFAALQRRLDSARRSRDRVRESIRQCRRETTAALSQAAACAQPPQPSRRPLRAIPLTRQPLTPNWLRSAVLPAPPPNLPGPTSASPSEPTAPPHIPHI